MFFKRKNKSIQSYDVKKVELDINSQQDFPILTIDKGFIKVDTPVLKISMPFTQFHNSFLKVYKINKKSKKCFLINKDIFEFLSVIDITFFKNADLKFKIYFPFFDEYETKNFEFQPENFLHENSSNFEILISHNANENILDDFYFEVDNRYREKFDISVFREWLLYLRTTSKDFLKENEDINVKIADNIKNIKNKSEQILVSDFLRCLLKFNKTALIDNFLKLWSFRNSLKLNFKKNISNRSFEEMLIYTVATADLEVITVFFEENFKKLK